ncbi:hypothetical protein [Xanthomonas oryzae]|uniref:hypothetical protein n=1 Tax=Xanthomonas oryzae TaxID=347 RepID=UPI00211C2DA9|nr:hypothetical protein [Xanthomonas oryzae]
MATRGVATWWIRPAPNSLAFNEPMLMISSARVHSSAPIAIASRLFSPVVRAAAQQATPLPMNEAARIATPASMICGCSRAGFQAQKEHRQQQDHDERLQHRAASRQCAWQPETEDRGYHRVHRPAR